MEKKGFVSAGSCRLVRVNIVIASFRDTERIVEHQLWDQGDVKI